MPERVMIDLPWPEKFFLPVWLSPNGWSICIHENMVYALDNAPDAMRVVREASEANQRAGTVIEGTKVGEAMWSLQEMSRAELFEEVKRVRVPIQYLITRLAGDKMLIMDLTSRNRPTN
jgi:hypothetical protein